VSIYSNIYKQYYVFSSATDYAGGKGLLDLFVIE